MIATDGKQRLRRESRPMPPSPGPDATITRLAASVYDELRANAIEPQLFTPSATETAHAYVPGLRCLRTTTDERLEALARGSIVRPKNERIDFAEIIDGELF